jgi:hypothetical protein
VMKPKDRIKSRDLERSHVPTLTDFIVDLIVYVFETAISSWLLVPGPGIVTHGIELLVREQNKRDVVPQ